VRVALFLEKPKKFYHPEFLQQSSHADFLKLGLFCTFDVDKILLLVFGIIMVAAKFS
jgi:hypothetical protein